MTTLGDATSTRSPPRGLPARVARALLEFKRRLTESHGDRFEEMRLFGSYARGEQHGDSDVDVLLLFRDRLGLREDLPVFDHVAAVDVAEQVWLSPLIYSRAEYEERMAHENDLVLDIQRDGILV
ncbi:MAG: nucleotidyltransferase domain-containing protein [Deltaproteobacteria bacterium]|nr:nucleotidyltransferase domain-containing protein [Deltaproteobacteria bacterium]